MASKFVFLLRVEQATTRNVRAVIDRLKRNVDPRADALWNDGNGACVFIETDLKARQIHEHAFPATLTHDQRAGLKDVLILQLGEDFAGNPQTSACRWLNARRRPSA